MKFGNYLRQWIQENNIHAFYFIDYTSLKSVVKRFDGVDHPSQKEEVTKLFMARLQAEMNKVYQYSRLRCGELTSSARMLQAAVASNQTAPARDELIARANSVSDELMRLNFFIILNKLAVEKIVKKHDKKAFSPFRPFLYTFFDENPFHSLDFDGIILHLSDFFAAVRGETTDKAVAQSTSFERMSIKYWVHPQDVMPVILTVIKHLPVYTFKPKDEDAKRHCSSPITSVYYDSEELVHYHKRIAREEGASLIRIRWYGDNDNDLFVERKLHHEKWIVESSSKDRFPMKEKNMDAYLAGDFTAQDFANKLRRAKTPEKTIDTQVKLFEEVKGRMEANNLKPMVRTSYQRFAFQIPGDATLRISLDYRVTMSTEQFAPPGHWRSEKLGRESIYDFPYSILEIKLQTDDPPEWIKNLMESNYVEAVPKFSKYGHGCCSLLPTKVKEHPFWLQQMDKPIDSSSKRGQQGIEIATSVRPPASHTPSIYSNVFVFGDEGHRSAGSRVGAMPSQAIPTDSSMVRVSTLSKSFGRPTSPMPPLSPPRPAARIMEGKSGGGSAAAASSLSDTVIDVGSGLRGAATPSPSSSGSPPPSLAVGSGSNLRTRKVDQKGKANERTPLITTGYQPPAAAIPGYQQQQIHHHAHVQDGPGGSGLAYKGHQHQEKEGIFSSMVGWFKRGGHPKEAPTDKRIRVPVRVEPKTYFANERTFLHWLSISVLLGMMSLTMLRLPGLGVVQRGAGIFLLVIAVLFMIYALMIYYGRTSKIAQGRAVRFDDPRGPVILVVCLMFAFIFTVGAQIGWRV